MEKIAFNIGDVFFNSSDRFPREPGSVGGLIHTVIRNAFVVSGIILVILIIAGGIGMISGAGSQNPQKTAQAKQAVTAGVIGFIIIFAAYWIVQIIEILTGVVIL